MGMSVLLIQAPASGFVQRQVKSGFISAPPLGLLSIATYLRQHGFDVHVRDLLTSPMESHQVSKLVADLRPAVVGLSAYAISTEPAKKIACMVKQLLPDTLTALGGPLPTFCAEELLQSPGVDVVGVGEGEATMLDLCRAVERGGRGLESVAGLALRSGGGVIRTARRPLIEDLDSLPIADRRFLDMGRYMLPFSLHSSRGCVGHCTFCSAAGFWGRGVRMRSMRSVEEELFYLRDEFQFRDLFVSDDTFTDTARRVEAFCDIVDRLGHPLRWYCNSRVDLPDPRVFARMYKSGCRKVLFGLESGNDAILRSIGKGITCAQADAAVRQAREAGLDVGCSFIVGHPEDTIDTIRQTEGFARRLREAYGCGTFFTINCPYPGTAQYDHAAKLGLQVERRNWDDYARSQVLKATRHLTRDEFSDLTRGIVEGHALFVPKATERSLFEGQPRL